MDKRRRAITREITDEEEARVQEAIASDPDNPEMSEERSDRARAMAEAFPIPPVEAHRRPDAPLPASPPIAHRRPGRPRSETPKVPVKLRLDPDVVDGFRALGPGWQTRMNEVLKRELPKLRRAKAG